MSTTGGTPQGTVRLLDEPDVIRKKFRSAVTDSGSEVRRGGRQARRHEPDRHPLRRSPASPPRRSSRATTAPGYGQFKTDVGDAVVEAVDADPGALPASCGRIRPSCSGCSPAAPRRRGRRRSRRSSRCSSGWASSRARPAGGLRAAARALPNAESSQSQSTCARASPGDRRPSRSAPSVRPTASAVDARQPRAPRRSARAGRRVAASIQSGVSSRLAARPSACDRRRRRRRGPRGCRSRRPRRGMRPKTIHAPSGVQLAPTSSAGSSVSRSLAAAVGVHDVDLLREADAVVEEAAAVLVAVAEEDDPAAVRRPLGRPTGCQAPLVAALEIADDHGTLCSSSRRCG